MHLFVQVETPYGLKVDQEPFLYACHTTEAGSVTEWSRLMYVNDLLRLCKVIAKDLQMCGGTVAKLGVPGFQGSKVPGAEELPRLDKNMRVLEKFARVTDCPAFLLFPQNVTSHVQKDHPTMHEMDMQLIMDQPPRSDEMYFIPGEDTSYWINSISNAIYYCYKNYAGQLMLRLVMGIVEKERFKPKAMLKVRTGHNHFDSWTLQGGVYAPDINLPHAEQRAFALFMNRAGTNPTSPGKPACHLFRLEEVPGSVVQMAEGRLACLGDTLPRRHAASSASGGPWSQNERGVWFYEGFEWHRFSRASSGEWLLDGKPYVSPFLNMD